MTKEVEPTQIAAMAGEDTLKVLVAEDEPAMLSLVARHMRSLGFHVIEASEGDVAWGLAQQHQPDLVILDVMMPGMSGWEICKRVKGANAGVERSNKTGVIMLTGIGENLNDLTSPLFAADAWLNKPFDFGELEVKVRETLGRYAKGLPGEPGDGHINGDSLAVNGRAVDGELLLEIPNGKARKPTTKKTVAAKKGAAKKPGKGGVAKKAAKKAAKPKKKASARPVKAAAKGKKTTRTTDAVRKVPSKGPKAAKKAGKKAAKKLARKKAR